MMSAGGTFKSTSPIQVCCASISFEYQQDQGSLSAGFEATVICCGCCPFANIHAQQQFAPDYTRFNIMDHKGFTTQGVLESFDQDKRLATYSYSGMSEKGYKAGTWFYDGRANTVTYIQTTPKVSTRHGTVTMERV